MPELSGPMVLDIIDDIANISARTGKEAILERYAEDDMVNKVLKAALDPFVTYGIKKIPDVDEVGDDQLKFNSFEWSILDSLAARDLTGKEAETAVVASLKRLCPKSSELFRRILLKDLRAGFSRNTVNKIFPGMIPDFSCMRAKGYEPHRVKKFPIAVEPKYNGHRALAFVTSEDCNFISRSGFKFENYDHLKKPMMNFFKGYSIQEDHVESFDSLDFVSEMRHAKDHSNLLTLFPKGFVMDGEIVTGSFHNTLSESKKKDVQAPDAIFHVFDIVPRELYDGDTKTKSQLAYKDRRKLLEYITQTQDGQIQLVAKYLASSLDEIQVLYESFIEAKLEGAMVKPLDHHYIRTKNHRWMKIKPAETEDLPIVGAYEGKKGIIGALGGFIVQRGDVEVRIGGGYDKDDRIEWWKGWNKNNDDFLGRLIEVSFFEETPKGSLQHPNFVRFRDDKTEIG